MEPRQARHNDPAVEAQRVVDDIESDLDPDAERAIVDDDDDTEDVDLPDALDAPLETPLDDLIEQRRSVPLDDERDA